MQLAASGYELVLTCRHGRAHAETVAAKIRQQGGSVEIHEVDLEASDAIRTFAESIGPEPIDALVQAAGSFDEGPFAFLKAGLLGHARHIVWKSAHGGFTAKAT